MLNFVLNPIENAYSEVKIVTMDCNKIKYEKRPKVPQVKQKPRTACGTGFLCDMSISMETRGLEPMNNASKCLILSHFFIFVLNFVLNLIFVNCRTI